MGLGKVHLLSETVVYRTGYTALILRCGKTTQPGNLVEYTNSIQVMESLPTTMTCKSCLKAMKGM
jgi:hypothetical protein